MPPIPALAVLLTTWTYAGFVGDPRPRPAPVATPAPPPAPPTPAPSPGPIDQAATQEQFEAEFRKRWEAGVRALRAAHPGGL